jgi:hypothetical protein
MSHHSTTRYVTSSHHITSRHVAAQHSTAQHITSHYVTAQHRAKKELNERERARAAAPQQTIEWEMSGGTERGERAGD